MTQNLLLILNPLKLESLRSYKTNNKFRSRLVKLNVIPEI